MKKMALFTLCGLLIGTAVAAEQARITVYVEPQNGFETYVAAAMSKKGVPADVVMEQSKAGYVLKLAPVEIKAESTGGKVARCLFMNCVGINDKGTASVQLIEAQSTRMVWAYSVNKQREGSKNEQSMAEAIAKHLKEFLIEHPLPAIAPPPVSTIATTAQPPVAVTAAPVATEGPAVQPVAQPAVQPVLTAQPQQASLGDIARHAREQKAKDAPPQQ